MDADRKSGLSRFIPFEVIGGETVGVTYNTREGKDHIINVVKKHQPVDKNTSFQTVKNSTMTRLSRDNFDTVREAVDFLKEKGLNTD